MVFFNFTSNVSGTANVISGESTGAQYQNSPIDAVRREAGGVNVGARVTAVEAISGIQQINNPVAYYIYKTTKSNCCARNGQTGVVDYSGSDDTTIINNALNNAGSGGVFLFSNQNYILSNSILVPIGNFAITFKGSGPLGGFATKSGSTSFTVSGTPPLFPDSTFMIDVSSGVTPGSAKIPSFHIQDINFFNSAPKTSGNATANRIFVGGIVYASDATGTTSDSAFRVERCKFGDLWRGIDMNGAVYNANLANLEFTDYGATIFDGNFDIRMWRSGAFADFPKLCVIRDVDIARGGSMDDSLWVEGAYHHIENYRVDGWQYRTSVFHFEGQSACNSNVFIRPWTLDLNSNPTPDTRQGTIYFAGYNNYGNAARLGFCAPYPKTVTFQSGAFRNDVELGFVGSNPNIDDSSAGPGNIVRVYPGAQLSGFIALAVTATSNITTIKDDRKGAVTQGTATVGSGVVSLVVSTSCFDVVGKVQLQPTSNTSGMIYWVSGKVSGAFSVFTQPSAFSGGFSFDWFASIYNTV